MECGNPLGTIGTVGMFQGAKLSGRSKKSGDKKDRAGDKKDRGGDKKTEDFPKVSGQPKASGPGQGRKALGNTGKESGRPGEQPGILGWYPW
jgi:hypothetical protein